MHADFGEIERALAAFERDLVAALKHCHGQRDEQPTHIALTVQ